MKNATVHAGILLLDSVEDKVHIEGCITNLAEVHLKGSTTSLKWRKEEIPDIYHKYLQTWSG